VQPTYDINFQHNHFCGHHGVHFMCTSFITPQANQKILYNHAFQSKNMLFWLLQL